jgi:hypothetical protein
MEEMKGEIGCVKYGKFKKSGENEESFSWEPKQFNKILLIDDDRMNLESS